MKNYELLFKNEINLLNTNDNLTNYYYYTNVFSVEEIDKIKEITKTYDMEDGNVSGSIDYNYRKSNICWLPINEETLFIYDTVLKLVIDANNEMWKFNITNLKEEMQFTEYNEDPNEPGHYDWHMDVGSGCGTRKLSVSIQLTDPLEYEGGDLEFMIHRSIIKAPREQGTVIMFPSYLTHRVTSVTKGRRNSLVFWLHGPSFI